MFKNIRTNELKGMIGKVNIIDVRKSYLYKLGSIPSSKNIPSLFLVNDPNKYLNKESVYYIYCTQGMESLKVCEELSKKGFNVVNVLGGYHDYLTS